VEDSSRDNEAATRAEFNGPLFQVYEERAFYNVEELVVLIVLVPVVFALHNTYTNHGTIHFGIVFGCTTGRCRQLPEPFHRSVQAAETRCRAGFRMDTFERCP
jgi:hypothetical protein